MYLHISIFLIVANFQNDFVEKTLNLINLKQQISMIFIRKYDQILLISN